MKSLNRFHEASLPKIEDFYSNVNMRDIADPDYNLEIKLGKKNLGEYPELFVQNDTF